MKKCFHCGGPDHDGAKCYMVKAIEYYENGKIKRFEYLTPADMPRAQTEFSNLQTHGTRQ